MSVIREGMFPHATEELRSVRQQRQVGQPIELSVFAHQSSSFTLRLWTTDVTGPTEDARGRGCDSPTHMQRLI